MEKHFKHQIFVKWLSRAVINKAQNSMNIEEKGMRLLEKWVCCAGGNE